MKITPIYISRLQLAGVKTFSSQSELTFGVDENSISQWTLILGDNGIGKSTLLQCIAWMKPQLPYDMNERDGLKPSPLINDEENEVLEALVSKHISHLDRAEIKGMFIANQRLNTPFSKTGLITCETGMTIGLNAKRKLEVVEPTFSTGDEKVFYNDEVLVYGYSAARHLGKQNLANAKLLDTIPGFISENTELFDTEEILHSVHYAALGSKNEKERKKYYGFIEEIKKMLVAVLPDFEAIEDIEILPPKVLLNDPEGGIIINTRHGKKIPFADFSLGYKTATSWTVDLAWRMFNKYQEFSNDPMKEPAIVLIDEIDLHLHPIWQREIMNKLSGCFPNVQFIATAHSPLMVQAALQYNYSVITHDKESNKVEIINKPEEIDGWRVDQILTSELFGLESARGYNYDLLIKEQKTLSEKAKLTKKEKERLDEIEKELAKLPTGESPEEIKQRKYISDLYEKLQSGKIKFEDD